MTKVIDGLNISLAQAIGLGFKRLDDQQFELTEGNKKFVLSGLVGVVKEIPILEDNDEDVQSGNSANGEQEVKNSRQAANKGIQDKNGDEILLAGDPLQKKDLNEELSEDRKALEQNGFHVIGEDGFQSGSGKKNNNVNKENLTGPSTIKANLETGHLELEREEEQRLNKKSKKS